MLGMHQQTDEVVTVGLQPEQHADTHIVDTARHGTVHGLGVVGIVALRSRRMKCLIIRPVIRLLKKNIRTDARVLQAAVVLHRRGGNVHIHAPDGPVLMLDAVNRTDALQHIFDRVVTRVLAGLQSQPLVSHVLQGDDFPADFFLRQLTPQYRLVLGMVRAIHATVHTIIGKVQRSEHHDAVAIKTLLDVACQGKHLFRQVLLPGSQQHGRLAMGKPFAKACFLQYGHDERTVVLMRFGVCHCLTYLRVGDKLFGAFRFHIIHYLHI